MAARPWITSLGGLVLVLSVAPARAATPTETLQDFFRRANAVITAPEEQATVDERIATVRALAAEVFDVREAAATALGRHWTARTRAEQDEFVRLFTEVLHRGYLALVGSKARVAGGVEVRYLDETVAGSRATVRTMLLTRTGTELPIDYRMLRRGPRWMVSDATIDGVSLVANYRAQFERILQSNSYADLVAMMRAVAAETPGTAVVAIPRAVPAPPAKARARSYWVQIGVFSSPDAATGLLERLRTPAVAVFEPSARPGQPVTRVLLGPFPKREAAAAKVRELKAAGYRAFISEE